ncbi:hypothetical protein niasHS_003134 [Heterodera schachtii]|uniref:DNA2/NAM7 helicase-like C-terminal domain-containing protein n=1 Tax=Heterodera schachtii TaxID=97005 RepID=A0ABD2KA97_HETSC
MKRCEEGVSAAVSGALLKAKAEMEEYSINTNCFCWKIEKRHLLSLLNIFSKKSALELRMARFHGKEFSCLANGTDGTNKIWQILLSQMIGAEESASSEDSSCFERHPALRRLEDGQRRTAELMMDSKPRVVAQQAPPGIAKEALIAEYVLNMEKRRVLCCTLGFADQIGRLIAGGIWTLLEHELTSYSATNRGQTRTVMELLELLDNFPGSIRIISLYAGQAAQIGIELKKRGLESKIASMTSDAMQGHEADLTIIATTVSRQNNWTDWQRSNHAKDRKSEFWGDSQRVQRTFTPSRPELQCWRCKVVPFHRHSHSIEVWGRDV